MPKVGIYTQSDVDAAIAAHAAELDAHTFDPYSILRTGSYQTMFPSSASAGVFTLGADTLYAMSSPIVRLSTWDRIAVRIKIGATAGSKARLGFYGAGTNLYPGALIFDAGEVAVDSAGVKYIIIDKQLAKGPYFTVLISNGTPEIYRMFRQHYNPLGQHISGAMGWGGWSKAQSYGALPATFPAGGSCLFTYNQGNGIFLELKTLD